MPMDESANGITTYWSHVADNASVEAYRRDKTNNGDSRISAETAPENSSVLDFAAFVEEYPEKFFALLSHVRPEFQELAIEYYLLGKSQSFLAKVHGLIQTRIWQQLRIIEQALGAMIVLGTNPGKNILLPILQNAGVEDTEFGSLTDMVVLYAKSQSYALVAKTFCAPIPQIRKIFRPAIAVLMASKDLRTLAVGCWLRNLTHLASLTGGGLHKRGIVRVRHLKHLRFDAPPSDESPLMSFGPVTLLHDTPWSMFEISSDHRMVRIFPLLKKFGKKMFNRKAAQIFAPTDSDGELELGYILARSTNPILTRSLIRVRGISEMAAHYNSEGVFLNAVTIPDLDVQGLIHTHVLHSDTIHVGDFVQVLTGDAAHYCGIVTQMKDADMEVAVRFPSGRGFFITADPSGLRLLSVAVDKRAFWGEKL